MLRIIIQTIVSLYLSIIILNLYQFARFIHRYEGLTPRMFLILFVFIRQCEDFFFPLSAIDMFITSFFNWDWVFAAIENKNGHYYINDKEVA